MPEFLAETYAPRPAAPGAADAALATDQASGTGAPVRLLGAILVPDEETCFWLYQAPSAGAVRAAMTATRLRPERITPAVPIRPPDPAPSPTAGPAATSAPDPDRPSAARRAPPGRAMPDPPTAPAANQHRKQMPHSRQHTPADAAGPTAALAAPAAPVVTATIPVGTLPSGVDVNPVPTPPTSPTSATTPSR